MSFLFGSIGFFVVLSLTYFYIIVVRVADRQFKEYATCIFFASIKTILLLFIFTHLLQKLS